MRNDVVWIYVFCGLFALLVREFVQDPSVTLGTVLLLAAVAFGYDLWRAR